MTLLPFQINDVVVYRDQSGVVVEVRGDRVVVLTADEMIRITTDEALRAMQPATSERGVA